MTITISIRTKVTRMDTGDVFTYNSLAIPQNELTVATKALSRLVKEGIIRRYKNGLYEFRISKKILPTINNRNVI